MEGFLLKLNLPTHIGFNLKSVGLIYILLPSPPTLLADLVKVGMVSAVSLECLRCKSSMICLNITLISFGLFVALILTSSRGFLLTR